MIPTYNLEQVATVSNPGLPRLWHQQGGSGPKWKGQASLAETGAFMDQKETRSD